MRIVAVIVLLSLSPAIAQAQVQTSAAASNEALQAVGSVAAIAAFAVVALPFYVGIDALKTRERPSKSMLALSYVAGFLISALGVSFIAAASALPTGSLSRDWLLGVGMSAMLVSTVAISLTISANALPDRTLVLSAAVPLP